MSTKPYLLLVWVRSYLMVCMTEYWKSHVIRKQTFHFASPLHLGSPLNLCLWGEVAVSDREKCEVDPIHRIKIIPVFDVSIDSCG